MQIERISIDERALAEVCRRYQVRELSVFGSVLRPDFREDSDIDLLMEFQPGATVGFLLLASLQEDLAVLFGRQVDLIPKLGLKPVIREEVLTQARVLYRAA